MNDLERARHMLAKTPELSCIVCKGEVCYTSEKRGIAPMMDFLDAGYAMEGSSVADRIVGRAAAMLFVLAGIAFVYAEVMSEGALLFLQAHGVASSFGTLTPFIVNRRGDGPCPLETAVRDIDDPLQAREAIRKTMKRLKEKGGTDTNEKLQ